MEKRSLTEIRGVEWGVGCVHDLRRKLGKVDDKGISTRGQVT